MKREDFELSKRVKEKLKHREAVRRELAAGKPLHQILEFSDEAMQKFYNAAYMLLEHARYTDAANAFLFLATLNPYNHAYWLGLGMAAQMNHDYESAIDAYEMAAYCEVHNPIPYFYLAKCLFSMHDRESTLQALDLAIENAGDDPEYQDLKRQAEAAKALLLKAE